MYQIRLRRAMRNELPDGDGVSVCREIRSAMPATGCLMLTSSGDDDALCDAIMAAPPGTGLSGPQGADGQPSVA